jgi:hypothetical protein
VSLPQAQDYALNKSVIYASHFSGEDATAPALDLQLPQARGDDVSFNLNRLEGIARFIHQHAAEGPNASSAQTPDAARAADVCAIGRLAAQVRRGGGRETLSFFLYLFKSMLSLVTPPLQMYLGEDVPANFNPAKPPLHAALPGGGGGVAA